MTLPSFLFGLAIASFYGAAFHLWRGGGLGRLALFLVLGWLGFAAGQAVASQLGWTFDSLGPLHLGTATVFSALFLLVGNWLSKTNTQKED
ncbi:MAG: hypothetical protein EHM70_11925 [Chloroflexota bacterium]|nr:MAG: hypothetical protein EHM70_11925 [Chloroflexota bacterium]